MILIVLIFAAAIWFAIMSLGILLGYDFNPVLAYIVAILIVLSSAGSDRG
jgi:hypothetical protein